MSVINQKEYLKKYLSLGDEKEKSKKRKKKNKIIKDRLKIIDDDIDVPHNINENELNEFLTAEDAPQVCGIVDERPLSMRIDDYRKSDKWKLVGSDDELKDNTTKNDVDLSPQRKTKQSVKQKLKNADSSPARRTRKQSDSDVSPPRKSRRRTSDSDVSPPRKSRRSPDSDVSPPRKSRKHSDSDASPPRRTQKNRDASPPRKSQKNRDSSPPRRPRKQSDCDASPPRKTRKKSRFTDASPPPVRHSDSDHSPPRKPPPKKLTKTLDGKAAGLQTSKDLKNESVALRKREDDMFKNMSAEISGKDAAPILRDRKTGKKRDLEKEAIEEYEKQQIENAKKEKYDKWGKGLKQVEDRKERIQEELHEMSKPLARYADDEDLEKYLKDQEREGDPMLQYIRKKKKDKAIASGDPKSLKPQYDGEFMPNRFGIPPGHRWDGVDRSNGYEKEWFKVQNSKKAVEEEIYKWSTEDM